MPWASTSRGRSTPSWTARLVISACWESCNTTLVLHCKILFATPRGSRLPASPGRSCFFFSITCEVAATGYPRLLILALAGILCKLLILWSGRPGSNRRRPAWEFVTPLNLQHFRVSGAFSRLTQVSLNHHSPDPNLLIEAQSRYIALAFVPRFARHSRTISNRFWGGHREGILRPFLH